jgi:cytochrome c biogenesis protein CcdA
MSDTAITKSISPNVRLTTFIHALAFVLGFSLVFIIGWGGAAA